MTPDWIALVVFAVFVILALSHYMALKIGWNLATKGEPSITQPKPSRVTKYQDPFDKEMLDID